jgi:hypothetical protein
MYGARFPTEVYTLGSSLLLPVCTVNSVQTLKAGGFGGPGPLSGPDFFTSPGPGRVSISHRNEDTDLPAAFNYTLESQGLGSLVPGLQGSDRWRHRQFGMVMSGTVLVFEQNFALKDVIGSHACSLEASMRVTNNTPLGGTLLLLLSV